MSKATKKPPTEAEMMRVIRAWVKANHPDEKDVQLTFWDSWGSSTAEYKVVEPPEGWESPRSLPDSVYDRISRQCEEAKRLSGHLRDRFTGFWLEAVADLDAYAEQLGRVCELIAGHPFDQTDIIPERVNEAHRMLDALVAWMLVPPIETKRIIVDIATGLKAQEPGEIEFTPEEKDEIRRRAGKKK